MPRRPRRYRPTTIAEQLAGGGMALAGVGLAAVLFWSSGSPTSPHFADNLWRIVIGVGAVVAVLVIAIVTWEIRQLWQAGKRHRALQLSDIDNMSGRDFELYVAELLKGLGYEKVQLTPANQDNGTDVLFSHQGVRYAAQLKRYYHQVNIDALYQASGGKDYYGADTAVVITNSYFNPYATAHAAKAGIWLVDRTQLAEWIVSYQSKKT
jgi:restriction system protein